MIYQLMHSNFDDYYKIEKKENFSFPHHMHQSFEIIAVTSGSINITVGENQKTLCKNDAAVIFPNQVHSMQTEKNSRHTLCIFSDKFVRKFSRNISGTLPTSNFITLPEYLADRFAALTNEDNICTIAGMLYMILGIFDSEAEYTKSENVHSDNLFYNIFSYISKNENCSMKELAKHTGYDYTYLSKLFKRVVGIPFKSYINELKINKSCNLLLHTNKSILELSEECGYNSLRSFNRNFINQTGITPTEYRKSRK